MLVANKSFLLFMRVRGDTLGISSRTKNSEGGQQPMVIDRTQDSFHSAREASTVRLHSLRDRWAVLQGKYEDLRPADWD